MGVHGKREISEIVNFITPITLVLFIWEEIIAVCILFCWVTYHVILRNCLALFGLKFFTVLSMQNIVIQVLFDEWWYSYFDIIISVKLQIKFITYVKKKKCYDLIHSYFIIWFDLLFIKSLTGTNFCFYFTLVTVNLSKLWFR